MFRGDLCRLDGGAIDPTPRSRNRQGLPELLAIRLRKSVARVWLQIARDVWWNPTVAPLAAVMLTALAGLIVVLTATYAPDAVARSLAPRTSDNDAIPPLWGYVTMTAVTVLALLVGFEPQFERWRTRWWRRRAQHRFRSGAGPIHWSLRALWLVAIAPAKLASAALSLADFILARPTAVLAGACWRGWRRRYAHLAAIITAALTLGLVANPRVGASFTLLGLVAVLSIVRRWTWIEADRDTFLVERGERGEGPDAIRIGFREDLRDEALFALVCLFLLVPLGLDQIQQATCAAKACAFDFAGGAMPLDRPSRLFVWAGYFGVEVAKAIPFVDWSEVFHVANGSPIRPLTALGSQVAFILRAGLDLLFLAAVLQAVQIATRLRDQEAAFNANRLPILEPFSERSKLLELADRLDHDIDLRLSQQPAVLRFPPYQPERLMEIVGVAGQEMEPSLRIAAAALLQSQLESAPDRLPEARQFWTERMSSRTVEEDSSFRNSLKGIVAGVARTDPGTHPDEARRTRLRALLAQDWGDARLRAAAARTLGRIASSPADRSVLLRVLTDRRDALEVRAATAVALAKTRDAEGLRAISTLIEDVRSVEDPVVVMSAAHAMAWFSIPAEEIAASFTTPVSQGRARAAAAIQRLPMDIGTASVRGRGSETNQLVRLVPGTPGVPRTFSMGSTQRERGANRAEWPRRPRVLVRSPYAIGRFTVTNGEYCAFLEATGRRDETDRRSANSPATWLSWHEAVAYCDWLNLITGEQYRLPTEAEWEFACRAGTRTAYTWGDSWTSAHARSNETRPNGRSKVGQYKPNAWGLWDMHGNVYEWCVDPWHDSYQGTPPVDNQPWLEDADFKLRVIRGGSGSSAPVLLRSAFRYGDFPTFRYHFVGFRLARTLLPVERERPAYA